MQAAAPLGVLADHFYDLMAFGLHIQLVGNQQVHASLSSIRDIIRNMRNAAAVKLEQGPRTDALEGLHETLDDYLWQIDREVLGNMQDTLAIMPKNLAENHRSP